MVFARCITAPVKLGTEHTLWILDLDPSLYFMAPNPFYFWNNIFAFSFLLQNNMILSKLE